MMNATIVAILGIRQLIVDVEIQASLIECAEKRNNSSTKYEK